MPPSYSSQIKTSDEVAEEAKEYLLCHTSKAEIEIRIKQCLKQFLNTTHNDNIIEKTLTDLFEQLKYEQKVYQYKINVFPDRSINIQFTDNPASYEITILEVRII